MVGLVNVGNLHGFADIKRSGIGLHLLHDQAEQSGLAGTVRTNDTDDAVGGQHEVKVLEELFVAESF